MGQPATAASRWAPAATRTIHPGTMMYTAGAQCTANFVFTAMRGTTYLGYAAHCAGHRLVDRHQRLPDATPSRSARGST